MVAAVAGQLAHSGGHYFDDCQEAYRVSNDADLADHPHGVKAGRSAAFGQIGCGACRPRCWEHDPEPPLLGLHAAS
jgi:hypothetical protein